MREPSREHEGGRGAAARERAGGAPVSGAPGGGIRRGMVRGARIVIGLIFLAAALAKIADPAGFALQVAHYRILPPALVHVPAILLPWIELLAGLSLVLGIRARSGAWFALGSLVVFTAAVGFAMARGLNFECGCFGTLGATRVGMGKLVQNLAMLAVAGAASFDEG